MNKKTRQIILILCFVMFIAGATVIVPYSMGYRLDFKKMKIIKTGGIYVRTFPSSDTVLFDSKTTLKPGLFSNEVFIQSLLPGKHSVLVKKEGYFDYQKTVEVEEERVTKLEDILLFKNNIKYYLADKEMKSPFEMLEKFVLKSNNLYYSNSKENSSLTNLQKTTPLLKKVSAFSQKDNSIFWLGSDGIVYKSDALNFSASPEKITESPIKVSKIGKISFIFGGQNIFLNNAGELLLINEESKTAEKFAENVQYAQISPDGKNIAYSKNEKIYVSQLSEKTEKESIIFQSQEKISDLTWVNNFYLIIVTGNKIVISEIDARGNVNSIEMPKEAIISAQQTIKIINPKINFNQQEGKLYVLTEQTLLISDKLIP